MAPHLPARLLRNAFKLALLVLALLGTQQAAQFHAMSHLRLDLSIARNADKGTPPPDHSTARCIAFLAVGSALTCGSPELSLIHADAAAFAQPTLPVPRTARIELHSRGPPVLF